MSDTLCDIECKVILIVVYAHFLDRLTLLKDGNLLNVKPFHTCMYCNHSEELSMILQSLC